MKRSNALSLNYNDILKGFIVAVIAALLTGVYQLIEADGNFDWISLKPILLSSVGAGIGYLLKNLFTNSDGKPLAVKEPKKNPYV